MIHSKQFILDQFAPIAVYAKLKTIFKNEISYLFESAGQSEGNYSFICIGARERLQFIDNKTIYTDAQGIQNKLDDEHQEPNLTTVNMVMDYSASYHSAPEHHTE